MLAGGKVMNHSDTKVNVKDKVNFIFKIANRLRGPYKPETYKDVVIPMLIIRRFECVLEKTKPEVLKKAEKFGHLEEVLNKAAGYPFHNKSEFDLRKLLNDPDNLASNFKSYIQGFSKEVRDIIEKLKFFDEIDYMDTKDRLYLVTKEFSQMELHPEEVSNAEMGYMFEELIRRFSENAEAGDHYTPREVIQLMVNVLLNEDIEDLSRDGNIVTVYDGTCGTGGMLAESSEYIHKLNSDTQVEVFGQEINDESYAICKADMLIKGQDATNIILGDTLTEDGHESLKVKYAIMNPPFGVEWKDQYDQVKAEHDKQGYEGRFGAGLPGKTDGALLFTQHMVSKLSENGRGAIIHNGSPLFSSGAESGESNIRKWLLENDLLEGIIALPTQMFYNTGIATYIFIIAKQKADHRKGKVQLVDASSFGKRLRKGLGDKRNELKTDDIISITEIYDKFVENEYCKIYDNDAFYYHQITVERPLQLNFQITQERIENLYQENAFKKLFDEDKYEELLAKTKRTVAENKKIKEYEEGLALQNKIVKRLQENQSVEFYKNREVFINHLKPMFEDIPEVKAGLFKAIYMGLSEHDPTADKYPKKNKTFEPDTKLRDTEKVPFNKKIEDYFTREVTPHIHDAWIDYTKTKIGVEIPFSRYFYKYEKQGSYNEYIKQTKTLEKEIAKIMQGVFN